MTWTKEVQDGENREVISAKGVFLYIRVTPEAVPRLACSEPAPACVRCLVGCEHSPCIANALCIPAA